MIALGVEERLNAAWQELSRDYGALNWGWAGGPGWAAERSRNGSSHPSAVLGIQRHLVSQI